MLIFICADVNYENRNELLIVDDESVENMYKIFINRITVGLLFPDSGKHVVNGDARIKKHSVTESVHSKRSRYSDVDEKGRLVIVDASA